MAGNQITLISSALSGAITLYKKILPGNRAEAGAWLIKLLRFCADRSNPTEAIGVLIRHLSSLPVPTFIEAGEMIPD